MNETRELEAWLLEQAKERRAGALRRHAIGHTIKIAIALLVIAWASVSAAIFGYTRGNPFIAASARVGNDTLPAPAGVVEADRPVIAKRAVRTASIGTASVLSAETPERFEVASSGPVIVPDTLPAPPQSADERVCLARAVYFEARGEAIEGQIAVAQVIMNRVRSTKWGETICAVVNKGHERGEKCQFSFACHAQREIDSADPLWLKSVWVADEVAAGRASLRELEQAMHYHTVLVRPVWRLGLKQVRRIGTHLFYVEPGVQPNLEFANLAPAGWDRPLALEFEGQRDPEASIFAYKAAPNLRTVQTTERLSIERRASKSTATSPSGSGAAVSAWNPFANSSN